MVAIIWHILLMLLQCLANVVMVLLAAPLCEGIIRKITARIQSRQGPPIVQPYRDLLKLFGKEDLESGQSPAMQRVSAHLSLAVTLMVTVLLPMGFGSPMNGSADVILLIYLITFCGVCTLIAGLAAGSTYSLIGISREMTTMITLEPILAISLVIGMVHTRSFRLDAVLAGSVYSAHQPWLSVPWSGILILLVMILAFQAFVQRLPFDIAEAETEIMEGPLMEYSGPKLALFKYSQMCRLVIHCALFIALFVPVGSGLPLMLSWPIFWLKVLVLLVLVTLVATTHARYRLDQAVGYFAVLISVSLVALVLASYGN